MSTVNELYFFVESGFDITSFMPCGIVVQRCFKVFDTPADHSHLKTQETQLNIGRHIIWPLLQELLIRLECHIEFIVHSLP